MYEWGEGTNVDPLVFVYSKDDCLCDNFLVCHYALGFMCLYVMLLCGSGRKGEVGPVTSWNKLEGRSGTHVCLTICYDMILCSSGRG